VTNGTVAPAAGQQLDNQLQPLLFSAQPLGLLLPPCALPYARVR
jgi:hypothetical protein